MHEKAVALRIIDGNGTPGGNGITRQFVVEAIITGKHILVYRIIHLHVIKGFAIPQLTVVEQAVTHQFLTFVGQNRTVQQFRLLGNGVISKRLELEDGIPVFQLAAPLRHREDDVQDYAAQEIKNAIAFIEEHTGEKWDWKAYFECAERVNYATKCRLEWLEMNKTDYPQVFGSNLALYTETNYMAICGKVPAFREVDRKITQLAERAYRKQKKAANEYRHRAIVWGVQSHFYMDFLVWLLNCWGIVPLTDMLSMVSTRELATTDTPENREQAYYDMAWLTENMIMRNRTHGGYKVLLDELWEFCEQFNADMVILWEHMSCKALDGMHGLFEERAREHGIHLVWVTHDLFDPRVISRQGVRQQVNDYMRTVMQEEPVDPSLEILKDEKSW